MANSLEVSFSRWRWTGILILHDLDLKLKN